MLVQELMPFKAVVVSTGGGAVTRKQNWGYMQHGVVVWLTGPPELLSRRALRDGTQTRPLLSQNSAGSEEVGRPCDLQHGWHHTVHCTVHKTHPRGLH